MVWLVADLFCCSPRLIRCQAVKEQHTPSPYLHRRERLLFIQKVSNTSTLRSSSARAVQVDH